MAQNKKVRFQETLISADTRPLPDVRNAHNRKAFSPASLGQPCPQAYPRGSGLPLGPPLSLKQVAALIGCSPWTVRQTLLKKGLPAFRSGASGKLIFYHDQVIRWIEHQQKEDVLHHGPV